MKKNGVLSYILACLMILSTSVVFGGEYEVRKKTVKAERIYKAPIIDGELDDPAWSQGTLATDFVQIRPYNGEKSTEKTEVSILYDDYAIYISAKLFDSQPDNIHKELSQRDNFSTSDYFGVYLDPYNDAKNSYGFFVTVAGVQVDIRAGNGGNHDDYSWDAVWESSTQMTEYGWNAEFKIPYSALRFPKDADQPWAIQFMRNIVRIREQSSWNMINVEISGKNHQAGLLNGIKDINPPLRLSLLPYVSGYLNKSPESDNLSYSYKAGLDLKLGISESFTMDMILIPDFGQVRSDDQVVNFSPFEVHYGEQRPFFIEGVDLFKKTGIFYSRRIGSRPIDYYAVYDSLQENEEIITNPDKSNLLNATKVSGKTESGLSVGILNALTGRQSAEIIDTITGRIREVESSPHTNYNMLVVDQVIGNHSNIAFTNTNVYRGDSHHMANVTGTEIRIADKHNNYSISSSGALSQIYGLTSNDYGYKYNINAGKGSGQLRFNLWQNVESDTYNPNDMGFLRANNEFNNGFSVNFQENQPSKHTLRWNLRVAGSYSMLYKPNNYTGMNLSFSGNTTLLNHFSTGFHISTSVREKHDYYAAREEGRVVVQPTSFYINTWGSPDYRNPFVVDYGFNMYMIPDRETNNYNFRIGPRWRVNDKIMLKDQITYNIKNNEIGYVDTKYIEDDGSSTIYFGNRSVQNITNTLDASYIMTNKASLSLRMRYYWLQAVYDDFYELDQDGYFDNTEVEDNHDLNSNFFNVDMVFLWNFAPGSEMSVVWKNAISHRNDDRSLTVFDNINNTFESPMSNSLSLKLLYYLDYQSVKKKLS